MTYFFQPIQSSYALYTLTKINASYTYYTNYNTIYLLARFPYKYVQGTPQNIQEIVKWLIYSGFKCLMNRTEIHTYIIFC